jgi:AcrR family transcriptional regulator
MATRDSYHHGNLREALLTAALDLLERDGPENLSLRRVAASVGVSHAAPAHHFPTLRDLLTALAARGFDLFATALAVPSPGAPDDPAARLRQAHRAYLAFGADRPGLFRLMFNRALIDWDNPALVAASTAAYAQLSVLAAPAAARLGLDDPAGREALERLIWTQAHGEAHLIADGKLPNLAAPVRIDLAALLFGQTPGSAKP